MNYEPRPYSGIRWRRIDSPEAPLSQQDMDSGILRIHPEALRRLSREAFRDVNFLLRTSRLEALASIFHSDEASVGDRLVAEMAVRNAAISADFQLPLCQDTGVASVFAWKGGRCLLEPDADDAEELARGAAESYGTENFRMSIQVPSSLTDETNSGTNLPILADIRSVRGSAYHLIFFAKGGGSSNKTRLFPEAPSLLRMDRLLPFLKDRIRELGTAACPPYRIALVIGGLSPEQTLESAKLLAGGVFDDLPGGPPASPGLPFRDRRLEAELLEASRNFGIGAQLPGRFFALDVRVMRLPRHSASLSIGLAVSCLADRQIWGRIDDTGVWLEELERCPGRFLSCAGEEQQFSRTEVNTDSPMKPPAGALHSGGSEHREKFLDLDLDRPMAELLSQLADYPVGTLLSLSGTLVVARDLAHARIRRMLEAGQTPPDAFFMHPIYYAGPARTPPGCPCGSFGPTTAGRMDDDLTFFQERGAALITLAKGGRSAAVRESCRRHGAFYLGTIGGTAALIARKCIEASRLIAFSDLGMEALREIRVRKLPAFIIIDGRGNDLYCP